MKNIIIAAVAGITIAIVIFVAFPSVSPCACPVTMCIC
jgi:hypothetical protein